MPLLPIPQPYDFELSTARFRTSGVDRANLWHQGGLLRAVGGREIRIEAAPGGVDVTPLDPEIAAHVARLLGLPFDLAGFTAWAAGDPVLARIVPALAGFRPPLQPDPFEAVVTSITAQQVSLQSACAIRSRLIAAFGEPAGLVHAFPTEERLARASEDELVTVGFSGSKAGSVVRLARAEVNWAELTTLPDPEVKERLTALRGIGEWTADWFLSRHLARPDAWPAGDLGVRKAVTHYTASGGGLLSIAEVRAAGGRFDPYRNLSVHYLLVGQRMGV